MMSTDLRNPNIGRRMTREEFVRNFGPTDVGGPIPERVLSDTYESIHRTPIGFLGARSRCA
eukprot:1768462-Prymnesium_polylepis.2